MVCRNLVLGVLLIVSNGLAFQYELNRRAFVKPSSVYHSPLFHHPKQRHNNCRDQIDDGSSPSVSRWRRVVNRLDTINSAGLEDVKIAGIFQRFKDMHNPITYMVVALMAGLKWDWCFRNPYYWFGVAFCVKWYRARYVFKIPVWDRQPNWNNIITSKEQEKDLKAFTCKVCGSTLFIAKTREFFFEGDTGIGGLGCFSCGAKGKENFVMDRDRIVEDVADMDDYFEYERPLDFVSRAERRKLMKEAGGDEDKANKLLVERTEDGDEAEETKAADDTTEETPESETLEIIDVEPEPVEDGATVESDPQDFDSTAEEVEDIEPEAMEAVESVESKTETETSDSATSEAEHEKEESETETATSDSATPEKDEDEKPDSIEAVQIVEDEPDTAADSSTSTPAEDGDKSDSEEPVADEVKSEKPKSRLKNPPPSKPAKDEPSSDDFDILGMDDF